MSALKNRLQKIAGFVTRRYVIILLLLAALVRIGYVLTLDDRWYYYDTVHYDTAAEALLQGQGFGEGLFFHDDYKSYCLEPIYPLFLALIYKIFGHSLLAVRIMQSLLSVLMIFIAFLLAKEISKRTAVLVLIFASFYPFFIYISGLLYITQIAALLFIIAFYALAKYAKNRRYQWLAAAGIFFGLSMVAKPVLMPAAVLVAVWFLIFPKLPFPKRVQHLILFGLLSALCLAPWTLRNYNVFHKFAPSRACISQVRTLEYQKHLIDRDVLAKKQTFDVQRFAVEFRTAAGKTSLVGFLDGKPFLQYTPIENIENVAAGNIGMILYGGKEAEIQALRAWRRDGDSLNLVLDTRKNAKAITSPEVKISKEGIHLAQTEAGWKYKAVFPNVANVGRLEMDYEPQSNPADTRRFAFWIGLDDAAAAANGYMVWLQPWLDIDIWRVENGVPIASVPTIKTFLGNSETSIVGLVSQYPVRFMIKHYIPEFFKFWSPFVSRITTSSNRPSTAQRVLSPLFFIPLLLLLPFGIVRLWAIDLSILFLVLIPIVTVSLGYSLFFAEIRFRIPIDSFLIILAMLGFDFILTKLEKRHGR